MPAVVPLARFEAVRDQGFRPRFPGLRKLRFRHLFGGGFRGGFTSFFCLLSTRGQRCLSTIANRLQINEFGGFWRVVVHAWTFVRFLDRRNAKIRRALAG